MHRCYKDKDSPCEQCGRCGFEEKAIEPMSYEEFLSRCTGECEGCEVEKECEEVRNSDKFD